MNKEKCENCKKSIICKECGRKLCTFTRERCCIEGHYCHEGITCMQCYI